jgi:sodium/proline symporter
MITASFISCLLIFVIIGTLSYFKSQKNAEDYLIAQKSISPWLAGLSAVATNNSGFMFIGMIGLTYATGLSSIWLMIGWIIGDLIGNLLAVKQIRIASARNNIHSFGGLLANWHDNNYIWLRRLSGLLTVIFLGAYAAAQLKAGDKATMIIFGWEQSTGIIIGAVIVFIYSFAGGLRASIWTDAAQSFVMLFGMLLLMFAGLQYVGGVELALTKLNNVNSDYMNWFPNKTDIEIVLFILGWIFGGISVLGQPHIVIRFMSLDKLEHINRLRIYYYSWFTFFYGTTIIVGLLARIILPDVQGFDQELALPTMAKLLLPDILVGLILAAMFAATISTADSLVIACSGAITRDFLLTENHSLTAAKMATAFIIITAVIIAISDSKTIFNLVLLAWGLLAAAFVPLILVYSRKKSPSQPLAITMMLVGIAVYLFWYYMGLGELVYEVLPAILSGLLVYFVYEKFFMMKQP